MCEPNTVMQVLEFVGKDPGHLLGTLLVLAFMGVLMLAAGVAGRAIIWGKLSLEEDSK